MVGILHKDGYAVSREAKKQIGYDYNPETKISKQYAYVEVKNLFNAKGVLKEGTEVGVLINEEEYNGIVKRIGVEITTINLTSKGQGIKEQLKKYI